MGIDGLELGILHMHIYATLLNITIAILIFMQYNIFIFFLAILKGVYHEKANQKNRSRIFRWS